MRLFFTIGDIGAGMPPAAAAFRCRSAFLNRCGAASCRSIFLRCRSAAKLVQVFEFLPQTAANFFRNIMIMPQNAANFEKMLRFCRNLPQTAAEKPVFYLWSCRRLPQNHLSHKNTKYATKFGHHSVLRTNGMSERIQYNHPVCYNYLNRSAKQKFSMVFEIQYYLQIILIQCFSFSKVD